MADSVLTDPEDRVAVLSDRTWDRHILVNHPEMDGGRDYVESAVFAPKSIWESATNASVLIYFGSGPSPHLLVVVKVNTKTQVVLTAHLAKRESGAKKIWPQS